MPTLVPRVSIVQNLEVLMLLLSSFPLVVCIFSGKLETISSLSSRVDLDWKAAIPQACASKTSKNDETLLEP